MKKQLVSSLLALTLAGCMVTPPAQTTSSGGGADEALVDAEAMLSMAQSTGGEWKVLDSATGGSAQPLSKLLKLAKEKAAAGETEEAIRLAKKVSTFAALGIEQANQQQGAKPYF